MSFEEFRDYIRDNILRGWMTRSEAYIQKIKKNNGVIYHGLYIREEGEIASPTIYLEEYFREYQRGESLENILGRIREEYIWAKGKLSDFSESMVLEDFSAVRENIIYRLVNYDRNRELLQGCPHIRLYDLALTFRWLAHTDEIGISTILISDREMELWGVTVHELILAAQVNTARLFPPTILTMEMLLRQVGIDCEEMGEKGDMYILTNSQQINGATAMVYDGVLEQFARKLKGDFYLLPSSIHEMILVPAGAYDNEQKLLKMVLDANRSIVEPGEILSDSVYFYSRESKKVSVRISAERHS